MSNIVISILGISAPKINIEGMIHFRTRNIFVEIASHKQSYRGKHHRVCQMLLAVKKTTAVEVAGQRRIDECHCEIIKTEKLVQIPRKGKRMI